MDGIAWYTFYRSEAIKKFLYSYKSPQITSKILFDVNYGPLEFFFRWGAEGITLCCGSTSIESSTPKMGAKEFCLSCPSFCEGKWVTSAKVLFRSLQGLLLVA